MMLDISVFGCYTLFTYRRTAEWLLGMRIEMVKRTKQSRQWIVDITRPGLKVHQRKITAANPLRALNMVMEQAPFSRYDIQQIIVYRAS